MYEISVSKIRNIKLPCEFMKEKKRYRSQTFYAFMVYVIRFIYLICYVIWKSVQLIRKKIYIEDEGHELAMLFSMFLTYKVTMFFIAD